MYFLKRRGATRRGRTPRRSLTYLGKGAPRLTDPVAPAPTDPPVGRDLRALRRSRGLTGQQLGALTGMSQAKISRIETGAVTADVGDVEVLASALQAPAEVREELVERAARSHSQMTEWRPGVPSVANSQREFAELEADARELRTFQPAVIIGLLQTSEYARAIMTGTQDHLAHNLGTKAPAVVSEAVSLRVRRHEILDEPGKSFHFVMTESVFGNRLSRPAVMLDQLDRVREVARKPNVDLRVVPAEARLSLPPYHGFEILDDRCVTVDLFNFPIMSRVRADIDLYRHVFDELERLATRDIEPILDRYVDLNLRLSTESRRQAAS